MSRVNWYWANCAFSPVPVNSSPRWIETSGEVPGQLPRPGKRTSAEVRRDDYSPAMNDALLPALDGSRMSCLDRRANCFCSCSE
jgi:hypothetical protein